MSDKKGIAALVLGMKKAPMDEPKDAEMEGPENEDSSEGKMAAAQDVLDAIKSEDAKSLLMALENLIEMCDQD